jgi:hypothetical protein
MLKQKMLKQSEKVPGMFRQFNDKYFGGKIPAYSVRVVHRISYVTPSGKVRSPYNLIGHCDRRRGLIEIRAGLAMREAVGTLLHEMAHAATTSAPGRRWKREMMRLSEAGAPLAEEPEMGWWG